MGHDDVRNQSFQILLDTDPPTPVFPVWIFGASILHLCVCAGVGSNTQATARRGRRLGLDIDRPFLRWPSCLPHLSIVVARGGNHHEQHRTSQNRVNRINSFCFHSMLCWIRFVPGFLRISDHQTKSDKGSALQSPRVCLDSPSSGRAVDSRFDSGSFESFQMERQDSGPSAAQVCTSTKQSFPVLAHFLFRCNP